MKEVLTHKENVPFTQVANAVLNDKELSLKAKGLFAYIYSKPQGWDFSGHRIAEASKDGRDSTYAGLKELEDAGYLQRFRLTDGRIEYHITWRKSDTENPEQPDTENPKQAKSQTGKTRTVSNKESNTNKEVNTNKEEAKQSFTAPTADSFFWKKKSKENDDQAPMDCRAFVLMCRGSKFRHVRILAEYADDKQPEFITRGQWRQFGIRNMKVAARLAPYTDRQLKYAMGKLQGDLKDGGGFIGKWGLETLEKYLDA